MIPVVQASEAPAAVDEHERFTPERLKAVLREKGYTQQSLAKLARYSAVTVWHTLNNNSTNSCKAVRLLIAGILSIPCERIFPLVLNSEEKVGDV